MDSDHLDGLDPSKFQTLPLASYMTLGHKGNGDCGLFYEVFCSGQRAPPTDEWAGQVE